MREPEYDLYRLFNDICENLPEDWEIEISGMSGEASVELVDPDGKRVDMDDDANDYLMHRMVHARINKARESDGLGPIEFDPI